MRRVELTPEIIEDLKFHRNRTGIGAAQLLQVKDAEKPAHLTLPALNSWFTGRVKTAARGHLEYIQEKWKNLPDNPEGIRVEITPEILEKLRFYRNITNVGEGAILRGKRVEKPKGLNAAIVRLWLVGEIKTAKQEHLDYALELWKARYTANEIRVEITDAIVEKLRCHHKRTGVGAIRLLQGAQEKVPDKLTATIIQRLLSHRNKMGQQNHIDYVLREWERLPDKLDKIACP
tara:strand:- start:690 stop:1388 length:699 start_codon:yes stop_codon:yes gene_type:complete